MPEILIVIPARYASTRLPGKPLCLINGKHMICRVAEIAAHVAAANDACEFVVAVDDSRVADFCSSAGIPWVMTSEKCKSGTERCCDAVSAMKEPPTFVVNLQGDNPLCPPHVVQALIDAWRGKPDADVYTPAVRLNWDEYYRLRDDKEATPFSGTTVMVSKTGNAISFSKRIIPAIRDISKAKAISPALSPVRRHVGLYAYATAALQRFFEVESVYEQQYIEGLEQLRFLENDMTVRVVDVDYGGRRTTSGVDSKEDVRRVEEILGESGELALSVSFAASLKML